LRAIDPAAVLALTDPVAGPVLIVPLLDQAAALMPVAATEEGGNRLIAEAEEDGNRPVAGTQEAGNRPVAGAEIVLATAP
jgi:hypothetical protein